jgi:hypothetical protein
MKRAFAIKLPCNPKGSEDHDPTNAADPEAATSGSALLTKQQPIYRSSLMQGDPVGVHCIWIPFPRLRRAGDDTSRCLETQLDQQDLAYSSSGLISEAASSIAFWAVVSPSSTRWTLLK